jgi:CPA1 family monovalent cation:H+ antiporter
MQLSLERIEIMLLLAAIVAMLARQLRLPYTVGLTLAGIGIALAHLSFDLTLTKELIFSAFLPPLIFEATLHLEWRELRADAGLLTTFATVGVITAAGVTVMGLHYVLAWEWMPAVLLAVLISATDPVSVLATFKEANVTGRLRLLMESESLLNDGTVAVFFGLALTAAAGGSVSAGGTVGGFFLVVAGGVACGAAVGGAIYFLAGRTRDHLVEITFSTIAAYGSFFVAEHFHLSGVLATLTAGMLIGNTRSHGAFSERGQEAVDSFWEYACFVANSLIFLLIGATLVVEEISGLIVASVLVIALVLVGRAISVYGCCALFAATRLKVSRAHQHVLVWGGLRGALALALALGLPADAPRRDAIIVITFAVVAFSVIVQGLTITPLLRHLGEIEKPAPSER